MNNLSLVIINADAAEYCSLLFASLRNQTIPLDHVQIVFIDNHSKDASVEIARASGVEHIYSFPQATANKGALYNKGAELACGDFVVFAHSDVEFSPDFFANLVLEPGIQAACVEQYYVDGQLFGKHQLGIDYIEGKLHYRQLFQNLPDRIPVYAACSEACFVISRAVLDHFSFDRDYRASFFEYSFFHKLDANRMIDLPNCKVHHYFLEMHDKLLAQEFDRRLFLHKHREHIEWKRAFLHEQTAREKLQTTCETQDSELKLQQQAYQQAAAEAEAAQRRIAELAEKTSTLDATLLDRNEEVARLSSSMAEALRQIEHLIGYESMIERQTASLAELSAKERALDDQLQAILNSGGWKFLLKYYNIRDFFAPAHSRRRLLLKLTKRAIRSPKFVWRNLNRNNLKKLLYYWKVDDNQLLSERIDQFVDRHHEAAAPTIKTFQPSADEGAYEKLIFPVFATPLVSIIIPVYNQFSFTYSCLKSILEHTPDIAYEIMIADDMSNDRTVQLAELVEHITIVRDGTNRGFLLNCNHAAQFAKGQYLLFLNNDTNVQRDWLKHLVDVMERDDTVGMAGSKLVYPDGRMQEAGGIIWKDASGWNFGRLDDPEKPEFNYLKDVDYISGAAIMVRAGLWKQIGGFDERYVPAYFEDSDLAFEIRKMGYRVVLQPLSVVVHFEGISHGTDVNQGVKSYQVQNREKFIAKWAAELEREQFENATHVFWARDRSRHKRTLVIVDHYVPHFDQDAGSRTVYQYIRFFLQCGFNVKFIGDNFFRHEPYTTVLQQMGVEVLYGNWYASHIKEWIKTNTMYLDYVLLNRPHISVKYIDLFKKLTSARIIYYGHDLHYLRELREYELSSNPALLQSSATWKQTELELCRKADRVYYPSQIEIDALREQQLTTPAKAIPAYIFDEREYVPADFSRRSGLLFVGGFGHKPNIDAVLWFVEHVFPEVVRGIPDIRLYIVGSKPPERIRQLQSEHIVVTGFVSDEELQSYYDRCRVVVVPLRFGAGVKGKVVEALYNQLPIITTSVGAEGLPDIDAYLVRTDDPAEFAQQTMALYRDEEQLIRLAMRSAAYVNQYFSFTSVWNTIADDFDIERNEPR